MARRAAEAEYRLSYVRKVLQPGETIVAIAKLHWIIYLPAWAVALLAVIFAIAGLTFADYGDVLLIVAMLLALISIALFVSAWFQQWITEIAVTKLRIIYKKGFIRRHTTEMYMNKIESVIVDQSVIGRILNYGTVHARGTGEGLALLEKISRPIELRNTIISVSR
jgi:hypothetical protein